MTRSRRAGLSRDEARRQPLYARMLGLQYLAPSGFLCFVFLEGAIALGILLALAELVSWWGVLVLPVTVAVMVKLNDVVAGALTRAAAGAPRAGARSVAVEGAGGLYAAGGVVPPSLGEVGDEPAPVAFSTTRPSRGARTVRLPRSVIAQAARAADHDRVTRGRQLADNHPGTPEPPAADEVTPEPERETFAPGGFGAFGPQPAPFPAATPPGDTADRWSPAEREPWTPGDPANRWTPADRDQWTAAGGGRWTPRDTDQVPPVPDPSTFPDEPEALNSPRPTWAVQLDDQQQRARQSAARRYE